MGQETGRLVMDIFGISVVGLMILWVLGMAMMFFVALIQDISEAIKGGEDG